MSEVLRAEVVLSDHSIQTDIGKAETSGQISEQTS